MLDAFTRAFGAAINDVRQRGVEEPFWGKIVSPRSQTITLGTGDRAAGEQSPAERLGWDVEGEQDASLSPGDGGESAEPEPDIEPEPDKTVWDLGIDL
jgi:hypothetical protein